MSEYFSTNEYQAPAVLVEILGVSFGIASNNSVEGILDLTQYEKPATPNSLTKFPNLITSLEVDKIIDGEANKYTLVMKYLPQDEEDPSYIDKLISANKTQNESKIIIAYGDGSLDGFFRKKYEALLTSYKMTMDLDSSSMTYTINAISMASAYSNKGPDGSVVSYEFPDRTNTYVSTVIRDIYNNSTYGLAKFFPDGIFIDGVHINDENMKKTPPDMKYEEGTITGGNYSPFEYLKSLVKLMIPSTIGTEDTYSYVYSINDSYRHQSFDINRSIGVNGNSYVDELVIGIEGSNVVNYEFSADHSYGIAVEYGKKQDSDSFDKYFIGDDGQEYKVDNVTGNPKNNNVEAIERDRKWWNTISNIPFGMSVTVRSMKKQLPLMSNIKVTVIIKGKVHFVSGIFYIVKSYDKVDSSGFYSKLELLKFSGSGSNVI